MVRIHLTNAGDTGSIPGQGTKIPDARKQLSPQTKTTKPMCYRDHEPLLENAHATTTEACTLWSPQVTTTESVCHN